MTWRERVARTLGNAFLLVALWSLVSWPWRHGDTVDAVNDALGVLGLPAEPSLFVIAMLLVLAGAVRRRLRAAYIVVVVLVGFSLIFQLLVTAASWSGDMPTDTSGMGRFAALWWGLRERPGFNVVCALVTLLVLVGVAAAFRQFPARLAHGSRRAALAVLVTGLLASFGLTLALTVLMPNTLDGLPEQARWALRATFGQSTSPVDPTFDGRMGHSWVFGLAGLVSAAALVLATLVLLRGSRSSTHQSADEELAVRRLLLEHGESDSLGYFATRRDKSVLFSRDGRAALTYRVEGTVCVASADPVGARGAWPDVIGDWVERCRTHGWHAAVLSCSEEGARAYVAAGCARSRWATRRSSTWTPSRSAAATCGRCARRSPAWPGPATPPGCAGTASSTRPSSPRSSGWPTSGAGRRPSAASRWRSTGWATRPTGGASSSRRMTRTGRCAASSASCRGAPAVCRWT